MIYNHEGKAVWDYHYTDTFESRCPICDEELVGKRYKKRVIWHWAHKPKRRIDCPHFESHWHMLAKLAQSRMPNWIIEHKIDLGHRSFRVDAYNTKHGYIREFIHTLTPYYYQKHLELRKARHDKLNWVFDGEMFVSARCRYIAKKEKRGQGYSDFLKETPFQLFEKIGGLVHYQDRLYQHWKNNVWFRYDRHDAPLFLEELAKTRSELEEHGTEFMIQAHRQTRQQGSSAVPPPPSASQSTN